MPPVCAQPTAGNFPPNGGGEPGVGACDGALAVQAAQVGLVSERLALPEGSPSGSRRSSSRGQQYDTLAAPWLYVKADHATLAALWLCAKADHAGAQASQDQEALARQRVWWILAAASRYWVKCTARRLLKPFVNPDFLKAKRALKQPRPFAPSGTRTPIPPVCEHARHHHATCILLPLPSSHMQTRAGTNIALASSACPCTASARSTAYANASCVSACAACMVCDAQASQVKSNACCHRLPMSANPS